MHIRNEMYGKHKKETERIKLCESAVVQLTKPAL